MQDKVRQVVTDFQQAITKRDVKTLESLLHPDFRVLANRFGGGENVTVLPRQAYLDMMQAQKIGGNQYEVSFQQVVVHDHSAAVEVTFASQSEADMQLFLLLVKDSNDEWKIISDMPVFS